MALSPGPDAAEKRASLSGPSSRYSVYSIGSILKVVLKVDLSVGERRSSAWTSAAMTRFTEHDAVTPISFAATGKSAASTVFVPLIQILLDQFGWRGALVTLGLVNILLCGGLYLTAIRPASDVVSAALPPEHGAHAGGRGAVSRAVRTPVFWALALTFTAFAASFSAFTFHLYPLLMERGLDTASTVVVLTCIGPAQVAGRVGVWLFAPHASVRRIGSVVVILFPLAIVAIALLPPTLLGMAVVAVMYGAANGIMTIVRGLAVPEMLSREAYGAISGALAGPSLVARAAAPVGAAAIWSATQTYDSVLIVIFVGATLTAIGFWIAARFSASSAGRM